MRLPATVDVVVAQVPLPPPPPELQADRAADTVPSAPTCRQRVPVPAVEEMMRLVVEAVPDTVKAVVDAYGKTEAVLVLVEVK